VSALGSSVNENQFLIDGTNFTCPCSGVARSEPGIDFIQEVQVQSIGASAEFGNLHRVRMMGSADVPRTGLVVAGSLRYFSGKPWAASTQVSLLQGNRRVLLEPPGSRRLSSQSLVDLRVSKTFRFGNMQRLELMMDLLNVFNDTAEEALVTDNRFSPTFGQPNVFMSPRRVMLGARLNVGR
jgi:hypothetical protein